MSGLLLVAADIRLADGMVYPGACYWIPPRLRPSTQLAFEGPQQTQIVSDLQPRIFLGNDTVRFWEGMVSQDDDRQRFYSSIAKRPNNIFPITFVVPRTLIEGGEEGVVPGFCRLRDDARQVTIEQTIQPMEGPEFAKEPAINPFALEPLLEEIVAPAREGRLDEALARAEKVISDHPRDSRCWGARSVIHAMRKDTEAALKDAVQAVECDPSDRDLYPSVCRFKLKVGDFESCLRYSDAGLAARYGSWNARAMYELELAFLGARSLFELGRYQVALDRLSPLAPLFGMGKIGDRLMTKMELMKAYEAALADM
jgi:tetratricopeptide (TPR) repeat protein